MEIDIAQIKIGDKVHYIPYEGCHPSKYENGMIKEIPDHTNKEIRIVFHCNGDWDNFMAYTSQLCSISKLKKGWNHYAPKFPCDGTYKSPGDCGLEQECSCI
jgi:hypothetical protein